ncbi:Uncharacterised protein [Stenotrophomonas maltophilia]|nr:Uncharacterised protein [Stenotrophomonas maltophilia]
MPGPGETFAGVGQQAAHADCARAHALHDGRVGLPGQQHVACLLQIAQRGRESPQLQRGGDVAQQRQVQLQQHSPLVAQQFMPLVHHHAAQLAHACHGIGIAQQQRQRFGRGHQHVDAAFAGLAPLAVAGVTAAQADTPSQSQAVDDGLKGAGGITGQRAQRRHPQHLQWAHRAGPAGRWRWIDQRLQQRPTEHRQRLAAARGRMQQPGFAGQVVAPHCALEWQ